jgi:hypothetical protein
VFALSIFAPLRAGTLRPRQFAAAWRISKSNSPRTPITQAKESKQMRLGQGRKNGDGRHCRESAVRHFCGTVSLNLRGWSGGLEPKTVQKRSASRFTARKSRLPSPRHISNQRDGIRRHRFQPTTPAKFLGNAPAANCVRIPRFRQLRQAAGSVGRCTGQSRTFGRRLPVLMPVKTPEFLQLHGFDMNVGK